MTGEIELKEKYIRNGWPSIQRPDLKPPPGWSPDLLTAVSRIRNHSLSPDGKWIAFFWDRDDLSDLYTIPASGGWPVRRSFGRGPIAYWDDEIPQWSPDSHWMACTIHDHVYCIPVDGGIPKKVSSSIAGVSSPVWMPDSKGLIVSIEREDSTQLLITDIDGSWPRPLVTDPRGDAWDARPSPDGSLVAYVHRPFDDLNRLDIRLVEVETGQVRTLVGEAKTRNSSPRWSPEGKFIAFTSEKSGFNEIWLVEPNGGNLHQLTHLGADAGGITWSPSGDQLAITVNRAGAFDLALVNFSDGEVRMLRAGKGYHARPAWSPKGNFLTFEYENSILPPDLYRYDLPSGKVRQLTNSNPPALACNRLVVPEIISYTSFDGLEIPAFLYKPEHSNGAAVVHPHGGPSSLYTYEWDIETQYFVAKGYTYLAPNYRGSTGYGLAFEHANYNDWGGGDLQDCLHAAKFLSSLPDIDPQRIAIAGGSYGGYLTVGSLARDPEHRYACGINRYGDANLVSSWAQCNRHLRLYSEIFLGHPSRNKQAYRNGSTIFDVANIHSPLLILHGLSDDVVPPQASEELVAALLAEGKTFEYKTYAGEPHGFLRRASQQDAYQRTERFLDWYLLP